MNSYSASHREYQNALSHHLPFTFDVEKIIDSFNNCEYLIVIVYGTGEFTFPYGRDFYTLIYHIVYTIKSKHPELFI